MININDEILHKYLDDELNQDEKDLVKSAINNSAKLRDQYTSLVNLHNLLKNMEPDLPSVDFNNVVMSKVSRNAAIIRQQKYFLTVTLSLFVITVLGITGYVLFQLFSSVPANKSNELVATYSKGIGDYFSNIFGKKNISIFGSILSFIMLISGYFLFEYQKQSKKKFSH